MDQGQGASPKIQRVVIVGGGTAGWMAAIYLNRFMRHLSATVTLVESPTLGTIGVGEATVPTLVHFIRSMNLDEAEFMRRCSATYKLAIKFDGWGGEGSAYWHAFGLCGPQINGLDLFHYWRKRAVETSSKLTYSDYSLQTRLCEQGKAPWPQGGDTPVRQSGSYAFHLDALALAEYLRDIATGEGVRHLAGHVKHVVLDDRGHIESLDIGGDRVLPGDLFIDATGFLGLLSEKALGDPWIDWSRYMLIDSAVAMPTPRDETFAPYTISKAMSAGWMWRIPLNSRVGNGYVYSSAHISTDEATAALIARSGLRKESAADPRSLKIRIGRRTHFWTGNCISVGLSSGFVEPLESTGIHLIQKAITTLTKFWPDKEFNDAARVAYNDEMAECYDEVRDFIILHYWLARRDESFWRDSRNVPIPDSLRARVDLYDETGRIETSKRALFGDTNYYFILAGNGRAPRRLILEAEIANRNEVWQLLDRVRGGNQDYVDRMPSHKAYLDKLHWKPV